VKKIVVIGPESTGKTTLTTRLAAHFQCPMVPEFAREYLDNLGRPYEREDLVGIAKGQLQLEESMLDQGKPYLFCDTDLRVIKIWSQVKYQSVDPWILDQIAKRSYHAYLLLEPDLPWEADPQREHPEYRLQLFERYYQELKFSGIPFEVISGMGDRRFEIALESLSRIINLPK